MRQVPNFTSYALIGSGKLSRHIECYLNYLSLPFSKWSRSLSIPLSKEIVNTSSHVLLAISDDAIEDFIQEHPFLKDKCLIHFSGAMHIQDAFSMHPLMTFAETLYKPEFYKEVPFVYEEQSYSFQMLLPGFPNDCYPLKNEMRSFYHALCVMAGNFPYILWCKIQNELVSKLNLPQGIMKSYLEVTVKNCFEMGDKGLTGPLSRGDEKSTLNHLKALEGDPFKDVYLAFIKAYRAEML